MKIHNFPGFFVDIEGLDGSGASTQVNLVAKDLNSLGLKPFLTKEPTRGPIGQFIRQALQKKVVLSPDSLQLLFAADRGEHLAKEIIPRLEKGEIVITDRYAWSSIAFGSLDLNKEWLFSLNKNFIFPDITVFIDVDPAICIQRIGRDNKRDGGVELFEEEEKLIDVQETYRWLVDKYWWVDIAVIDGEKSKEKVTAEIMSLLKKRPKFRKMG